MKTMCRQSLIFGMCLLTGCVLAGPLPNIGNPNYRNAVTAYRAGQETLAVSDLKVSVIQSPQYAPARELLGYLYMKDNQAILAVTQLAVAARLAPKDASVHNNLGSAYLTLGRYRDSVTEYRAALALAPANPAAHANLAAALLGAGMQERITDPVHAATDLTQAVSLGVTPAGPAEFALGELYGRADQMPKAAQAFMAAAKDDPQDYAAWYDLGVVQEPRTAPGSSRRRPRCRPIDSGYCRHPP
jgi:Flp pilus assembly protein TadD